MFKTYFEFSNKKTRTSRELYSLVESARVALVSREGPTMTSTA